jgi:hypothetical protein
MTKTNLEIHVSRLGFVLTGGIDADGASGLSGVVMCCSMSEMIESEPYFTAETTPGTAQSPAILGPQIAQMNADF